jgi:hypothetical protein
LLQVKPRLVSGERKLSNQNQHLFEEGAGLEAGWDREEVLLSTLLFLLHRVKQEDIVLTQEEERRWLTFTNLKRRVNKAVSKWRIFQSSG